MFAHDPSDTKPCLPMRRLVSALADGALTGLAKWYTEKHIAGCRQCQKGLATIKALRDRLRALNERDWEYASLSSERWAALESAWQQGDQRRANCAGDIVDGA